MSSKVFILGNGKSRTGITCEMLSPYGFVFGCNAIYRSGERPDALVVHDKAMQDEVQRNYDGDVWVMVRKDPMSAGYSGGAAMFMALNSFKPEELYLIGFDHDMSNIYAGSKIYKDMGISLKTIKKRINYEKMLASKYPETQIIQVVDKHSSKIKSFTTMPKSTFLEKNFEEAEKGAITPSPLYNKLNPKYQK